MKSIFAWLGQHKMTASLVAVTYAALTILPHDVLQNPALAMQQITGMVVWHFSLLLLIAAGIAGIARTVYQVPDLRERVFDFRRDIVLVAGLLIAGSVLLMVNSVEHIHYLQYVVLALILSPLFGHVYLAVVCSILVGALDEGYQYFVLHPWQPYFDFNDVVLNGLGAVTGGLIMLVLSSARDRVPMPVNVTVKKRFFVIWSLFFVLIAVGFVTGYINTYLDGGQIVLNRFPRPEAYGMGERWIDTGWGNHWYKLQPAEGLVIVFVLPFVVRRWWSRRSPVDRASATPNNTP